MFVNKTRQEFLKCIAMNALVVRAKGSYLYLKSGKKVLDMNSQYGAVPFGHNPEFVQEAIKEFLSKDGAMMVQPYTNPHTLELSKYLSKLTDDNFQYVNFSCSGAEAVDSAIKLVRYKSKRYDILTATNGFHGRLIESEKSVHHMSAETDNGNRNSFQFGCVDELEKKLRTRQYAALLIEIVQGEGGIVTADNAFLQETRALCDRYGTYLIFDEIQTGFYRTGTLFAYQSLGVMPDILLLGKAMGGGVVPISACLSSDKVWSELFCQNQSSTFSNNGLSSAVGCAVANFIVVNRNKLEKSVRERSAELNAKLKQYHLQFPEIIASVRGVGLLAGLEFKVSSDTYFFRYMSSSGLLSPLVSSYLLNNHNVHFAPTLKRNNVLRIEPSIVISEQELNIALTAIENVLTVLNEQGVQALVKEVVNIREVSDVA